MFKATVNNRDKPDSKKISHLKTLLTGKANAAVSGRGYLGEFYAQAWELLGRKFGRPYLFFDAQLKILRKQQPIQLHDSTANINHSITISKLVNVLKQYNYEGDLRSSSTLQVAIEKLPPSLKENWFFFVDERQQERPDLTNRTFNLMEVGIILGKDAYEIQRPLDYKIGTRSEPFAVLTELGGVVSGPMRGKTSQNVCHFASAEDVKVAENIHSWRDIEDYASKTNDVRQSKKEQPAQKFLESTTKFTGELYEVGML